jgi:hypothetical protein
MFVIRSERTGETGSVSVWLASAAPRPKWGVRETAIKFVTNDDARRIATGIGGAWRVEPA